MEVLERLLMGVIQIDIPVTKEDAWAWLDPECTNWMWRKGKNRYYGIEIIPSGRDAHYSLHVSNELPYACWGRDGWDKRIRSGISLQAVKDRVEKLEILIAVQKQKQHDGRKKNKLRNSFTS